MKELPIVKWLADHVRQECPEIIERIKAVHPEVTDKSLEDSFLLYYFLHDPDVVGPNTFVLGTPGGGQSIFPENTNGDGS